MVKVNLSEAPGCIGSYVIHNEKHAICANCNFTSLCGKVAAVNYKRLCDDIGVEELTGVTGRLPDAAKRTLKDIEELRPGDDIGVKPLSQKGGALKASIEKGASLDEIRAALKLERRVEVHHALQFITPDWALELLLLFWDNKGELKKSDLREFLVNDLGYAKLTAMSSASIFINATTNLGLVTEFEKNLRVKYETDG